MNIVRCPRCLDDVTVPVRASPKALVRCPLCLEEYLLREALGGLPPELIVLDGSEAAEEPALVSAGYAEVGGDEYRLSGGAFGAALDASGPSDTLAAPRPVVKGARPKRKEKSAFVELIKIVLGGVVGLTLGYFVLLWGFSMDVLGLGPKITPYAPWIVPAKFHGQEVETSTAAAGGAEAVDTSGDSSPAGAAPVVNGNGTKRNEQGAMEPVGGIEQSSATDAALPPDLSVTEVGGLGGIAVEPNLKPIPLPEPDLGPLLPEVNPKPVVPAEKPEPKPEPTPEHEPTEKPESKTRPEPAPPEPKPEPKPEPEPAPAAKPLPTAEELAKVVLRVSDATTKVNEATGQPADVRRQLFIDFYGSASEAGRVLSLLDTTNSEFTEQVTSLKAALESLARQPGKVSALKSLTDLNWQERKHDEGVLLSGVVQEFSPAGTHFAAKFQAGKSQTETVVVSASDPMDALSAGDELLLVGRVIDDPAKNLPGYEGDAARVVLLGVAVPVPKAE